MGRSYLQLQLQNRINSSGINKHNVDEIVDYLQVNHREYCRMKNFRNHVVRALNSIPNKVTDSNRGSKEEGLKRRRDIEDAPKKKQKTTHRESCFSSLEEEKFVAETTIRSNHGMEVEVESKESRNKLMGATGEEVKGKEKGGVKFKDFGGIKVVLEELMNKVIVPFCHPQLFSWLGVKPISGILFYGPPGCGKTRLANAIANETGVPFYKVSATELVSGVSGASEENIRDLFSKAYRTAPSIVFIDEIDAIASKRETHQKGMEGRIVTQLLTCMDELHQPNSGKHCYVIVIGATNRPDDVDPALRRPGRFDREIMLPVPDEKARVDILSVLTTNLKLDGAFDLHKIARSTPGFVGADLEALATEAGHLAVSRFINSRKSDFSKELNVEECLRLSWLPEEMENFSITMVDFEVAAKIVQSSSTREGFSPLPPVQWEDVGGLDFLREEFNRYIINHIKHPEDYAEFGVDLEVGILLHGPPGCGKTLIAQAVANEAGAAYIYVKGPSIFDKYVGNSEQNIRTIFSRARTSAPCIIFIDEVDALTTKRGEGGVGDKVVTQLLTELNDRRGVYVIAATNRLEMMDDAVIRSGRLGKALYVPRPGPNERGLILKAIARKKQVDEDVDLMEIGKWEACKNLSGADLAAVMNDAATAAVEEKKNMIGTGTIKARHIEQALKKLIAPVSDEEKKYYDHLKRRSTILKEAPLFGCSLGA